MKDKFVILSMIESTVRSGLELLIPSFGEVFRNNKSVVLYIKDRNPTEAFKQWVKEQAEKYNVEIIHDGRHTESHDIEKEIFSMADCHFYLNHSGTWCMTVTQGMACGIPTVSIRHSGPTDYLSHMMTGLAVEYDVVEVTDKKLKDLEAIGMKNYLFPRNSYINVPYWAEPRLESIKNCMVSLLESRGLMNKLSEGGILCAKTLTWERTAVNMGYVLGNFKDQREDKTLIKSNNRYE